MATLSEQDRAFINALIDAAAERILGKSKDFTVERIGIHTGNCPHLLRGKAFVFGLLFAATLSGGGVGLVLIKVAAALGWIGGG
jgi:hypothetical protein